MTVYTARLVASANKNFAATGTTYATVRTATTATTTPGGTTIAVGQGLSGTLYSCGQLFLTFDTSGIPSGQTTGYLYLNCTTIGKTISAADYLEVRECSTDANLISGDSLAALTLLGSIPLPVTATSFNIPLDLTSMTRGSSVKLVVHAKNQRLATAPSSTDVGPIFNAIATGTAALKPAMDFDGAWKFRGVGTVVENVTGSATLTLTEPSGAAQGDLLVAMISMRSTATAAGSISIPSGWARVSENYVNNVLTTSSAQASATMAYIVRGASAPSYAFPYASGNSVIQGQVIAYNPSGSTPALDVAGTPRVTTIATTAISVTGITTLTDDSLLVVGIAGGQEANITAFNAATDPNGLSGTLASTANPIGVWLKHFADNGTTSGADTATALGDVVKATAGATGNLTATASISAAHTVLAAAFRLLPPGAQATGNSVTVSTSTAYAVGPTTFNTIDKKDANVVLSNGNLTVTGNGTSNNWVRSARPRTGKRYVEFTTTTVANSVVGIAAGDTAVTFPGADANSFGLFYNGTGSINGSFPPWTTTFASGDVVGMAVDLTAKLVWYRKNGGAWNSGGSADPATGVGGRDISAYTGTTHYVISSADSGGVTTANFGATAFGTAAPAGYLSWDGTPDAVINVSAMPALTATVGTATVGIGALATVTTMAALTASQGGEELVVGKASVTAISDPVTTTVGSVTVNTVSKPGAVSDPMTITAGTVDVAITGAVFVTVTTTTALTASLGNETIVAGTGVAVSVTSSALTALVGDVSFPVLVSVSVTGISMTASAGSVSVVTAGVSAGTREYVIGGWPAGVTFVSDTSATRSYAVPGSYLSETAVVSTNVTVTINGGVASLDMFCRGPASPISVGNSQFTAYGTRVNLAMTPPGVTGDLLIMEALITATGTPPTITPPSGWTEIFTPSLISDGAVGGTFYGWWRQQQPGDGVQTFSHASAGSIGWMGAFKNVNGATPIDVTSGMAQGLGTTTTVPSITTIQHNAEMLVLLGHDSDVGNRTPPSGWTETLDSPIYVETVLTTTTGATGSVSMTNGNSSGAGGWQAMQLALIPNGVTVVAANGAIVSAVPAMTISVGTATVATVLNQNVNVTSPAMTLALGDESVKADANVSVDASMSLFVGQGFSFVNTTPGIPVTMDQLTISVGDVIASVPTPVPVVSDPMLISVGDVVVAVPKQVFASGNFMLLSMGDETIAAGAGASPSATMPALTATCGTVTVTGKANVSVTSPPLTISIGNVTVVGKATATIVASPALTISCGSVTAGTITNAIPASMPALTISTATPGGISVNYAVRVIVTGMQLTCDIGGQAYIPQVNTPYQREGIMKTMANMMGN